MVGGWRSQSSGQIPFVQIYEVSRARVALISIRRGKKFNQVHGLIERTIKN